jgi:hypothetical protein
VSQSRAVGHRLRQTPRLVDVGSECRRFHRGENRSNAVTEPGPAGVACLDCQVEGTSEVVKRVIALPVVPAGQQRLGRPQRVTAAFRVRFRRGDTDCDSAVEVAAAGCSRGLQDRLDGLVVRAFGVPHVEYLLCGGELSAFDRLAGFGKRMLRDGAGPELLGTSRILRRSRAHDEACASPPVGGRCSRVDALGEEGECCLIGPVIGCDAGEPAPTLSRCVDQAGWGSFAPLRK